MRLQTMVGGASACLAILMSLPSRAADDSNESAASESTAENSESASDGNNETTSSDESNAPAAAEAKGKKPGEPDRHFLHSGQASLRLAFVAAYRIISRYDTSPYCEQPENGSEPKKMCGFGAPPALDLALGYALSNFFEPYVWARFGLSSESVTQTKPLVALGVGARLYTLNDSAFKFFIQPAVGWELESGTGNINWRASEYKQDFLMQLLAGPQYDFAPNVGAYATVGFTAGIFRAIQTWSELDIGIQARLP